MFNLPDFPDVYNTRHIICVSCKEKFGVTEGTQAKIHNKNGWRVQPSNLSNVSLRHEPDRQQRTIVPTPHQTPSARENETQFRPRKPIRFSPKPINCPRCGADNRNWLSLKQEDNLNFRQQWQQWQRFFPTTYPAIFLSAFFALIALSLPFLIEISWLQAIVLAICTPVATALFIADLSAKWNDLREDKHIAKISPKSRRLEPILWFRSFVWLVIATIVVPVLFFSIFPTTVRKIVAFVSESPETAVEKSAEQVTTALNGRFDQTIESLNEVEEEIEEKVNGFPTGNLPQIEAEIVELSDTLANTVDDATNNITAVVQESTTRIETKLDNELSTLTTARKSAIDQFAEDMGGVRYFAVWGFILGLPLLSAIMMMVPAIKEFAAKVDKELPPPVFYSVNNMTRLVTWEARQALEIDGDHHTRIQWVSVKRNELGGLDLVGLFRDPPEFDMYGQVKGDEVRAQKHTIHTDKWCRIIDAKIKDVMVPIPAGAPAGVLPLLTRSSHDAPANVRVSSPVR